MLQHEIQVRVRYAETDKMGYVYYGNYASYLEVARVEMLRNVGQSYKEMEDSGILMPVLEYKTKYIKPAKYDDLLTIKTVMRQKPGIRIVFEYEVFNEDNTLLNISETTLVFIDSQTERPTLPPSKFLDALAPYFDEKT